MAAQADPRYTVATRQRAGRLGPKLRAWLRGARGPMGLVALPEPDHAIVARRDAIVADLRRLVGAEAVIADEDGRRAYETDALTAYRQMPLAVVLPDSTRGGLARAALLPPARHQGGGAGRRHLPFGRRAAHRGCRRDRRLAHEPGARGRLRQPRGPRRGRRHQPRHQRGRQGAGLLLRARSVEPARLHARRQHRHELGRRALPQVRRDHQQRARPQDGADGRRGDRDRRRAPGFARLRPDGAGRSARRASSASPRRPPCASCARPKARGRCCSASTPARPPANASRPSSAPASCRWPSSSWTSRRSRCARRSPRPAIPSTWRRC